MLKGERHTVRQRCFHRLNWYAPAPIKTAAPIHDAADGYQSAKCPAATLSTSATKPNSIHTARYPPAKPLTRARRPAPSPAYKTPSGAKAGSIIAPIITVHNPKNPRTPNPIVPGADCIPSASRATTTHATAATPNTPVTLETDSAPPRNIIHPSSTIATPPAQPNTRSKRFEAATDP